MSPQGGSTPSGSATLPRQLGLLALTATGICSMVGASIYVVPFMVQRHVPGIGPSVWLAFLLAAVPAALAAFAYASLASAMPSAGGSYIYASRGLHPYLGFVASFSQWFGLCVAIGVIAYVIVPFLRDVAFALGAATVAGALGDPTVRLVLALGLVWLFAGVNLRGARAYERTLIPMMVFMFLVGAVVMAIGVSVDPQDFPAALKAREGRDIPQLPSTFSWAVVLQAAAVLFSSFIGFDSIAQAGGEAKDPRRTLPLAIGLAIGVVSAFYFLFSSAVYRVVPWQFIAAEAAQRDITAPGLLAYVTPAWLTVWILAGAAVALTNDLPAMILSVSRLLFAWAEDGLVPRGVAAVHPRFGTPHRAILLSAATASAGVLGCHLARDFFLGVDVLVVAMLFNFILMCVTVLAIARVNPPLAARMTVGGGRTVQRLVALLGLLTLSALLVTHVRRDLSGEGPLYLRSTVVWLVVMAGATVVYVSRMRALRRAGVDVAGRFRTLP